MDTAAPDPRSYRSRVQSDPHVFRDLNWLHAPEEEASGLPVRMGSGMGSGRRDARVVCETLSGKRNFGIGSPKMRQSASQRGLKTNATRKTLVYSRNPLLACFVGESVLSSRANMHLSRACDSSLSSQKTFFSLIPVDKSQVNEKTGEPQSPQLSCIGQVKHRQVKTGSTAEVVTDDLARMDINDGVIPHSLHISKPPLESSQQKKLDHFKLPKGESFWLQKEESFKPPQYEETFKLQKVETFQLRREQSFKVQKEESFKRQIESAKLQRRLPLKFQTKEVPFVHVNPEDIPHLDLGESKASDLDGESLLTSSGEKGIGVACKTSVNEDVPIVDTICVTNVSRIDTACAKNVARLTRSTKRVAEEEERAQEEEKTSSPSLSHRNSIRYLNHFLKQKLGASMVRTGFVCGWSSGEVSPRSPDSADRDETESEHCEIDLSRFAPGEFQPRTPSFRDARYYQHSMGKKLPDIRVHSNQRQEDRRWWNDEREGKEQNDVSVPDSAETVDSSPVVIRCSPGRVILQPATEAALWKRRSLPRPVSLETHT